MYLCRIYILSSTEVTGHCAGAQQTPRVLCYESTAVVVCPGGAVQGSCDVFPLHPRPKIPQTFAVSSVRLSSSVESDISISGFLKYSPCGKVHS